MRSPGTESVEQRRPHHGRESGFGLVEVLIAVVLLSVGVLGVAALTLGVSRQSRRSARETGRTLAAGQVLDSIRGAGFAAAADGRSTLAPDGRAWRASWAVRELSSDLKRVDVRIAGPGATTGERGDLFTARLHRPSSLAAPSSPAGAASASATP